MDKVWKANVELSMQGGETITTCSNVDVYVVAPTQEPGILLVLCIQTTNLCKSMMIPLELPPILFMNHQKDTPMKLNLWHVVAIWLQHPDHLNLA